MKKLLKLSLAAGLLAPAFLLAPNASANGSIVTIGTGGQTGVYFVVGTSICKFVNLDTAKTGIKCNAPSTGGSVANVNSIIAGEFQFGISQSDVQYQAYHGTDKFENKPYNKLRAVFSIHPEAFTLLARADQNIKTFTDTFGKRVNIGGPGSGMKVMFEKLLPEYGKTTAVFSVASELKPAEMAANLCDNNLDVISYVAGNPNGSIKEATSSCDANLVSVTGPEVNKLLSKYPYYAAATIPGGTYKGTDKDTKTVGVYATLVTSSDVSDEQVYQLVKSTFTHFERFKKLHPAFATLTKESMIKNAISAPLHPGAVKYYKEAGLIK